MLQVLIECPTGGRREAVSHVNCSMPMAMGVQSSAAIPIVYLKYFTLVFLNNDSNS